MKTIKDVKVVNQFLNQKPGKLLMESVFIGLVVGNLIPTKVATKAYSGLETQKEKIKNRKAAKAEKKAAVVNDKKSSK